MVAAAWTLHAKDITERDDEWSEYLTIGALKNMVGLAEPTIRDLITRNWGERDPRSAIRWPAGRIGGSPAGVGAQPMWNPEQGREYLRLAAEREREREQEAQRERELPVISAAAAAEHQHLTIDELVAEIGRPKSTVSRWMREHRWSDRPFPPKVGFAERVSPHASMGPPKPLYDLASVREWIETTERYEAEYGGGRGRRRRDVPTSLPA